jgi:NAD(P)-dependent dehydrogenase (short-subunit alcohol dehydrogenase family)
MGLLDLARGITAILPTSAPDYDVAGKVALVTGGGDGIGRAVVRLLHERGAHVAVLDRDADAAGRVAATLDRAIAFGADVRDRPAVAAAVAEVADRLGGLDVVVANAGIAPPAATLRQVEPEAFDAVIDVNLTGVFNTVRPALDHVAASGGHVSVVASCAAFVPGAGGAAYMASKAAAEQLGRALRIELAPHGATAGTVYFGLVDTQMTRSMIDGDPLGREMEDRLPGPLRRRITPDEAAEAICDGVRRRSARTVAPPAWRGWLLTRGIADVVVDRVAALDPRMRQMVREVEDRM